jgi:hypothetical protein
MTPKLLKTLVIIDGAIQSVDTFEHEGKLWLVPYWIAVPAKRWTFPGRIIRMDLLRYSPFQDGFALQDPIPKELFDDRIQNVSVPGFEVVERPKIPFER